MSRDYASVPFLLLVPERFNSRSDRVLCLSERVVASCLVA